MNKFQRAGQGVYGAIENALDDLRHTWERFAYGRKVTGEVDMFTPTYEHTADPHQETREAFERVYGKRDTPEQGQEREREREGRAREPEQEREIER
ncbi:hypothetical protein SAMN02949497_0332 [Methylomagnum ishizawai]|uniref:Uncharacterized protein n=2 Tax=Methylomagnum ishizawai TaxID=1760988 RepID=A0A1Y6DD18_9GAMM|nr:hypothetical protein SAMN02949497_0320 [Methylomagnum ishizawai]SMF97934.1 hypothetical protein SAMN02949497_0332 [Methylomagnum ishizawai]